MKAKVAQVMFAVSGFIFSAQAVTDFYKADNGNNFNLTTSWIGGVKPGVGDRVWFTANTLNRNAATGVANWNWVGIVVSNNSYSWTITDGNARPIRLGFEGITMAPGNTGTFTMAPQVYLTADQVWTVSEAGQTVAMTNKILNALGGTLDAGSIALTKAGAGTLVLSGAGSTFSGGLVIDAGTVTAGDNNVLGAGSVTMNGGTLAGGGKTQTNDFVIAGLAKLNGNTILSGQLSGTGSVLVESATTAFKLTLTGDNSGFSGAVTNKQILVLGHKNGIGTGVVVMEDDSTLSATSGAKTDADALANNFVLNGNAKLGAVNATANMDLTGLISGLGSLQANHASVTTTLKSANTYEGGTMIGLGKVVAGVDNALGTGTVTIDNGATLSTASNNQLDNAVVIGAGGGNIDLDTRLHGNITGSGSITHGGTSISNVLLLAGDNSGFSGNITNNSQLTAGHKNAWGTGTVHMGTGVDNLGTRMAASTNLTGANAVANNMVLAGIAEFSGGADLELSGIISGAGSLNTLAGGVDVLTLAGENTYAGGTTVNGGTVQVGAGGTSGSLGSGAVTNHAALVFNRSDAFAVGNVIGGSGSLDLVGGGTLALTGANTYSGATTLGAGTLVVSNTLALQNSRLNYNTGGGTVQFGANATAFTLGGLAGNQDLALTNLAGSAIALTVGNNSADTTFTGVLSASGSLVKAGTGTFTLNTAGTYSGGTVVNAGTLKGGVDNPFGSGALTLNDGAILSLGNKTIANEVVIPAGQNATITGNATLDGTLSGSGNLTHSSFGDFKLSLNAENGGFSGNITNTSTLSVKYRNSLGTGTLYMQDDSGVHSTLAAKGDLRGYHAIANNIVLLDSAEIGTSNGTGDFELKGTLSGPGGLIVDHSLVTLTLSGANTYFGATDIAQGGLIVNGTLQNSAITAESGTTLGGTGTVQGVVMNAGSLLQIGTEGSETMTFTGDLTLSAGATNRMQVFSTNSHDVLMGSATNNLVLDGVVLLDFTFNLAVDAGDSFDIFQMYQNWNSITQGANLEVATIGLPGGLAADLSLAASNGTVSIVTAVVDPIALPDLYPISMTYHGPKPGTNTIADELLKYTNIEILGAVANGVWDDVRATFPDKIVLKQDAWGGTVSVGTESAYPGHWLLKVGTKLSVSCSPTDTVLHVEDYSRLAANQGLVTRDLNNNNAFLLMYALDGGGQPDWSRAEHLKITAVDTVNGTITVDRAQHGSWAQAFTSGEAVIARHMLFWYDKTAGQWQLNFSMQCPRGGPLNLTAAEWFALQMKKLVDTSGADGIEFDVARWQWGNLGSNIMDCNNDLVADYGYIDGVQSFGLGGQVFVRELRRLLGPGKIIQMDSNGAFGQARGWQYVNGCQMESFPNAGKFDAFSEAFLHLRQYRENIQTLPNFSYPYVKTPTTTFENLTDNGADIDWHFRTSYAAGLLTGMPSPFSSIADDTFDPGEFDPSTTNEAQESATAFYKWDEYVAGDLDDWQWLGKPLGEAVQVLDDLEGTDLLASATWHWVVEPDFSSTCAVSNGEYTAEISALASVTNVLPINFSEDYPGSTAPKTLAFGTRLEIAGGAPTLETNQQYTLEFEARGNDSWDYGGEFFEYVPRAILINGIANHASETPDSFLVNSNWNSYRITILSDAVAPYPIAFGVSEQVGNAAIRNIRLYKGGAERWTREFERGRIYLNMTKNPWNVNVSTGVVQRFVGTQSPELNNGAVETGTVAIPPYDAAFLLTGTFGAWQVGQLNQSVSDDFSIGFDGRAAGDSLVGFDVQTGLGTWSNVYTAGGGSLAGNMKFVSGGGLTESTGTGGGVYLPLTGSGDAFALEVVVTPNDFGGSFTIGFLETIDSGFFLNNDSDHSLKIRYIQTGVNIGKFQFDVFGGGLTNTTYSGRTGSETVNATDAVRLSLSYNTTNGDIVATAYNLTGDYELSAKTINVPGLVNLTNAGFGWSSIPDQTTTPSVTPGVVSSFRVGYDPLMPMDESISGATADPDGDGLSNLQEYFAGTNPQDAQSVFLYGGHVDPDAAATVLNWSAVSGRLYDVYWTSNLLYSFEPLQLNIPWTQASYTSSVPGSVESGFYQIKAHRP